MPDAHVTVVGNATRDASLKFTPAGIAVANFGIAVNKRVKNPVTNEWEDGEASFFDVSCWREMAENAAESITKGTRVVVTGKLEQRSWEAEDGSKRSKVEIVADEIGPSIRWATVTVVRNERSNGARPSPVAVPAVEDPFSDDPEPF